MRFQCSHCGQILLDDSGRFGQTMICGACGQATTVPASPTEPRALVGEFIIERLLGVGGMSIVYLAHREGDGVQVALKLVPESKLKSMDNEAYSLYNEASIVEHISHPAIVQSYGHGVRDGFLYSAMEYVDGPVLDDEIRKHGRLSEERIIGITEEVVSALQYAWTEYGIIHGDLKPANIILTSDGHAKLLDFGQAIRQWDTMREGEEVVYGTPDYLPPELILRKSPTMQSDIYSLGATLYELATARKPYPGQTPEEKQLNHLHMPLLPVRAVCPCVTEAMARFIELMLVKRQNQRYQNYEEILNDLALVREGLEPSRHLPASSQNPIDEDDADPLSLFSHQKKEQTAVNFHPKKPLNSSGQTPKISNPPSKHLALLLSMIALLIVIGLMVAFHFITR